MAKAKTSAAKGKAPGAPSLILATDLDGTFLGGNESQRRHLYDWIEAYRHKVMLIYVTGRDIPFIQELIKTPGLPAPDYVVGDVGTTVVDRSFKPVADVQDWVAERWGDAGARVRAMLADAPGLEPQPTPFARRMSYFYKPEELRHSTVAMIRDAGFDVILSADVFLDVMPRGVAKGPTLVRLIKALGLPSSKVLVAGDTLNDLSLFETGLKGVAMGNSEPKLVAALPTFPKTYHSPLPGCAGIADGIRHFGFSPKPPVPPS